MFIFFYEVIGMKAIVLYSTRTGNTKKVAEAVTKGLPAGTLCLSVTDAPANIDEYDCVFVGYWVDRGFPDAAAKECISKLTNAHVALFGTLGADPDSEHGSMCIKNANSVVPEGCTIEDSFICQGAVDPKIIAMMYKQFPQGHPHGQSAERDALHARAAKHPDETDLEHATKFATRVWSHVQ